MRISDWSSDVCSSDLGAQDARGRAGKAAAGPAAADRAQGRQAGRNPAGAGRAPGRGGYAGRAGIDGDLAVGDRRPAGRRGAGVAADAAQDGRVQTRTAEHTSELQSLMRISYSVFCLKKKNAENK